VSSPEGKNRVLGVPFAPVPVLVLVRSVWEARPC